MLTTKLRTVGGSVMLAIPKSVLETLGLATNQKVGVSVEDGKLIVEPRPRPRYALSELLAQCDVDAAPSEEERAWLADKPMGREAI